MLILITGGARSGKSRYAQHLALSLSQSPYYVATAKIWDQEFAARVQRHQSDRGPEWTALEEQFEVSRLPISDQTAVIDCVTLWLTNYFSLYKQDIDRCLISFQQEIDILASWNGNFILVSNEVGMGLHGDSELGRKFIDLQGWANQYVAAKAQQVIFMVSGLPLKVK